MKNRDIRESVFKNEVLGVLPGDAFQLFCGLWCYADREGRFEWRPARIKAEIFPYRSAKIEDLLGMLVENRFVHRYSVEGKEYGWVINFAKHQYRQKHEAASKLPEPPDYEKLLLINNNEEKLSSESIHDGKVIEDHVQCSAVHGKGKMQGKGMGSAGEGKWEIPEKINTPEVEKAVLDWLAYKAERKEAYKPTALKAFIKRLAGWTPERIVAAIEWSMSNNWKGLFEQEEKQAHVNGHRAAPPKKSVFDEFLKQGSVDPNIIDVTPKGENT